MRFDRRATAAIAEDGPIIRALTFLVVPALVGLLVSLAFTWYLVQESAALFGSSDAVSRELLWLAFQDRLVTIPITLLCEVVLVAAAMSISSQVTLRAGIRIAAYAALFQAFGILGLAPWIAFIYSCARHRAPDTATAAALALLATVALGALLLASLWFT